MKKVNDSKPENEWIAVPDQKIAKKIMIVDFPGHLKLHLSEIDDLIKIKN